MNGAQITLPLPLPLPLAAHLCTEGAQLTLYRSREYEHTLRRAAGSAQDWTWMARFIFNDDAQTTFRAVGEDLQPTLDKLSALIEASRGH